MRKIRGQYNSSFCNCNGLIISLRFLRLKVNWKTQNTIVYAGPDLIYDTIVKGKWGTMMNHTTAYYNDAPWKRGNFNNFVN